MLSFSFTLADLTVHSDGRGRRRHNHILWVRMHRNVRIFRIVLRDVNFKESKERRAFKPTATYRLFPFIHVKH